jgi:tetratricopeptide (TPR) repeat protein
MAKVKSQQNKKIEQAIQHFKRYLELNPRDYNANFEIAELLEQQESSQALHYYEQGLKLVEAKFANTSKVIPPEIYNNIGVLRLQISKTEEAKKAFESALHNCD